MTKGWPSRQDDGLMRTIPAQFAYILTLLFALVPSPAAAGQDWVDLRAVRVAQPGGFQASLGVSHAVEETWALGDRSVLINDIDGSTKVGRQVDLRFALAWQWDRAWGLKVELPYVLAELSPYPAEGTAPTYRLTDPLVRRTDGLGDASVEIRRAWGPEPGQAGIAGALWMGVMAPTGIGPFEAPHPLAATGEGRWQLQPGFVLGLQGRGLTVMLQSGLLLQGGREAAVSRLAPVAYGVDGPTFIPGGDTWLGPRYGVNASLGLGWDWYADDDSRQTLACEILGWQHSPLDVGGTQVPDTEQVWVGMIPELQSHFGRFHVLAGWSLGLYANNLAFAYYGVPQIRVDYGF